MSTEKNSSSQPCLHQLSLRGHKAPVLSLAHSSNVVHPSITGQKKNSTNATTNNNIPAPCCLLSGSEDGTARLWDLRCSNNYRASLCILAQQQQDGGKEVSAVSFHPIVDDISQSGAVNTKNDDMMNTNNISSYSIYPFTVYMAVGSNVYGYDLRNTSMPIIRQYDFHLEQLWGGEEINEIAYNHLQKKKQLQLAVADDDGLVRITHEIPNRVSSTQQQQSNNTNSKYLSSSTTNSRQRPCRILQHDDGKDGSTLVTSCAFRPGRTKSMDIITGGTDCTINLWDIDKPRYPSSTFHVQSYDEEGQQNQIYNPPLVQSLSWSPSGRLCAAGLGDGTCLLLSVEGRRLKESCRLYGGHSATVASVLFPQFGFSPSSTSSSLFSSSSLGHITAEDRLFISAGNDGEILLWDLGSQICGLDAIDPSVMFVGNSTEEEESEKEQLVFNESSDITNSSGVENDIKNMSLSNSENDSTQPKILYHIPHGKKPNKVVTSKATEPVLPSSLFVADTSCDITAYILPRR